MVHNRVGRICTEQKQQAAERLHAFFTSTKSRILIDKIEGYSGTDTNYSTGCLKKIM